MNAIDIVKALASLPAYERTNLIKAHEAASEFHAALESWLIQDRDIEDYLNHYGEDGDKLLDDMRDMRADAFKSADAAMQHVPVKWLAALGITP